MLRELQALKDQLEQLQIQLKAKDSQLQRVKKMKAEADNLNVILKKRIATLQNNSGKILPDNIHLSDPTTSYEDIEKLEDISKERDRLKQKNIELQKQYDRLKKFSQENEDSLKNQISKLNEKISQWNRPSQNTNLHQMINQKTVQLQKMNQRIIELENQNKKLEGEIKYYKDAEMNQIQANTMKNEQFFGDSFELSGFLIGESIDLPENLEEVSVNQRNVVEARQKEKENMAKKKQKVIEINHQEENRRISHPNQHEGEVGRIKTTQEKIFEGIVKELSFVVVEKQWAFLNMLVAWAENRIEAIIQD